MWFCQHFTGEGLGASTSDSKPEIEQ